MSLFTQLCESDSDSDAEKILVGHVTSALENGTLGTVVQVLRDIYSRSSSLNPLESAALSALPLVLVPAIRGDDSSSELVHLIGIHANAKEVILSIDELMDPGHPMFQNDEGPGDALDTRLMLILDLYQSTVPRLVIRKRPPAETLRPILERLSDAIVTLSYSEISVFNVMTSASRFADVAFTWATQSRSGCSSEDHEAIKKILTEFLLKSLVACSSRIDPDIALRVFQKVQPRYTLPRPPAPPTISHSDATRELVLLIYTTFSRIQDSSELRKYRDSEPIVTLGALVLSVHVQHLNPPLSRAPLVLPLEEGIIMRTIIPALISSAATTAIPGISGSRHLLNELYDE
ncbi:hypothetical protein BS47DRAFT_1394683 [Hydnum rufescens UP504]|uniref:Uncharacterized protein n=1 Tax=Hydnum rufescens UP504 TaxID=1448309 RepID=A0A9P6DRA9_9AGAM|nr:hypothetical protein BS47DRAFT_1394683 [Hydnum rufescens UP504]